MDKVQIFTCVFLTIETVGAMLLDGRPKEGSYSFVSHFVSMLVILPLLGRIFLWW